MSNFRLQLALTVAAAAGGDAADRFEDAGKVAFGVKTYRFGNLFIG